MDPDALVKKHAFNDGWRLVNEERGIDVPITVPCTVFEALLANGLVVDPFVGENEHEVAWVYESDWTYSKRFVPPPEWGFSRNKVEPGEENGSKGEIHVILRFNGLDTIATVRLNGRDVLGCDNMHRVYEVEMNPYLVDGENLLEVKFESPTKVARERIKSHGISLKTFDGLPGVPYLRKAQYSFGWDWGPKLPDTGIWRPVEVIVHRGARIESWHLEQEFTYNTDPASITSPDDLESLRVETALLSFTTRVALSSDRDKEGLRIEIRLETPGGRIFQDESAINTGESSGKVVGTARCALTVDSPETWWCHDLGEPLLHGVSISLLDEAGNLIDEVNARVGIRDVQLVRDKDRWGETFYFRLNGIPVWAKGANWIPVDSFIPRGKKLGLYEGNILAAKAAGMNMLRVWGGGIYEDDLFYDLCDSQGILVWQDFPFACSMYPWDEEFLENVRAEAEDNIKRLAVHPSLVIWCGNNEIEELWTLYLFLNKVLWIGTARKFRKGYVRLFEKMLPELVKRLDPGRPYWPSSPSSGGGKGNRGLLKSNSPDRGDSHFWKVWHMGAPFSEFRKFNSRFMSEYGFESFPSIKTLEAFCPPDQMDFYSPVMENHQKNAAGNKKIMRYMKRRFSIPASFEKQVVLSQLTQAEAIEYGVEHWRRNRNDFHCMGSLYWQLNDCWPVASWSSIDYFLRWKALHYVVRRCYRPFHASTVEAKDRFELWVTNDLPESKGAKLEWQLFKASGDILLEGARNVDCGPCQSCLIETIVIKPYLDETKHSELVLFFSLDDGVKINHGFRLAGRPGDFPLRDPCLTFKVEEIDKVDKVEPAVERVDGKAGGLNEPTHVITVTSEAIALYVHLDATRADFLFSDNFFSMRPGETRVILATPLGGAGRGDTIPEDPGWKVASLHDLR